MICQLKRGAICFNDFIFRTVYPFSGGPALPHKSLFLMFIHEGLFHNSSER